MRINRTATFSAGAGTSTVKAAFPISRLLPATTYSYRVVVDSPAGRAYGSHESFTTGNASSAC